jgi:putative salt-induced outer membrane protein YdiY
LIADVVYFDNGDRLSGDIASLIDNKLTLENTPVGKIEVDTDNVKTFSTDEPIDIYYPDGGSETRIIEQSDEGLVAVKNSESEQLKQVEISDIFRLGPLDDAVIWSGNVRSGLNGSSGNSDTLNFNVGLNLQRRSLRDRATLNGEYIFQQSDGDTEENKWFTELKYDYFISNDIYSFSLFRIGQDEASDLDLRTILSTGLGYQWIERKDLKFATEAGFSWLYEDFSTGMSDNKITLRLAYHYENNLWDKVRFFNNLEFYPKITDPSDFFLTTTVGLRTNVSKTIFTEAKVIYQHDSTPAEENSKNNVNYLFSLGMNF